jgi:hypothetical protein
LAFAGQVREPCVSLVVNPSLLEIG